MRYAIVVETTARGFSAHVLELPGCKKGIRFLCR